MNQCFPTKSVRVQKSGKCVGITWRAGLSIVCILHALGRDPWKALLRSLNVCSQCSVKLLSAAC